MILLSGVPSRSLALLCSLCLVFGYGYGQEPGQPHRDSAGLSRILRDLAREHEVHLVYSEEDLARVLTLPLHGLPEHDLDQALDYLRQRTTLQIARVQLSTVALYHDEAFVSQLRESGVAQVTDLQRQATNFIGTEYEAKSTDELMIEDEPLFRAFDQIGLRYNVTVLYHPQDIPLYRGSVRQAPNPADALRLAIGGTNLRYVGHGRDTFVVAPLGKLTREYISEVIAAWREGRFSSPDRAVAEVLRYRVGAGESPPSGASAKTEDTATGVAIVTGYVFDERSDEALVGASVVHPASGTGTVVDLSGEFALSLPRGRQLVEIQYLGYVPQPVEIQVLGDGALPVLRLREGSAALTEVVVAARNEAVRMRQAAGGLKAISSRELKLLPAFTAEPDVLLALTRTPGVAATSEGSVGLSVRGGGLDANLVRQGGIPVLYPAHALGFFPAFHGDLVAGVELYRGYVPAGIGGRSSSAIEVEWRTGDFEKWHLSGATGPLSSRLAIDGPIVPGKVSVIAGARRSHLNWLLRMVNQGDLQRSVVDFGDAGIGVAARWGASRLDVRAFTASDEFRYGQRFGFAYRNTGARAELRQRLNTTTTLKAAATVSTFHAERFTVSAFPDATVFTSGLTYLQGEIGLVRVDPTGLRCAAGVGVEDYRSAGRRQRPLEEGSVEPFAFEDPNLRDGYAFAEATYKISETWLAEGGLRLLVARAQSPAGERTRYGEGGPGEGNIVGVDSLAGAFNFTHAPVLQPRAQLTYSPPNRDFKIGLAYSRLAQPIHQLSPTVSPTPADIFFVSSEYLPITTSGIVSITIASQEIRQSLSRWGYEAAVYHRQIRRSHMALSGELLRASATPEQSYYTADGFAAGVEGALRYRGIKNRVELGYAYGRSLLKVDRRYQYVRLNDGRYLPSNTDLPHQANVTYSFRPTGRFTFSAAWTLTSGRPFTAVTALLPQNGSLVPLPASVNSARLPTTHRLDIGVDVDNSSSRSRGLRVGYAISVYNVYRRQNPFAAFYDRPTGRLQAYQFSLVGRAVASLNLTFQWD